MSEYQYMTMDERAELLRLLGKFINDRHEATTELRTRMAEGNFSTRDLLREPLRNNISVSTKAIMVEAYIREFNDEVGTYDEDE